MKNNCKNEDTLMTLFGKLSQKSTFVLESNDSLLASSDPDMSISTSKFGIKVSPDEKAYDKFRKKLNRRQIKEKQEMENKLHQAIKDGM